MANYVSSVLFVCLWLGYVGLFAYFEQNPIFALNNAGPQSIANGCPPAVVRR